MKAVICDDDATIRGIVDKLATVLGYEVLAETDSAVDAVQLVQRFGADVLILELALPWSSGREAVRALREAQSACQVVLFTSYGADDPEVRGEVVRAVIEKPDFDRLEHVLKELLEKGGEPAGAAERRQPVPERPLFPAVGALSPSGLEDPLSFQAAVTAMEPGDAVLAIRIAGVDATEDLYGRLLVADRILAATRTVRGVLRRQDRMSVGDTGQELLLLLLNSGRPGVEAVWRRVEQAHDAAANHGTLSAGWSVHESGPTTALTVQRAQDAAARSVGQPPGARLRAG